MSSQKTISFLPTNEPNFKVVRVMGKLKSLNNTLSTHPPSSPDFAPCDCHLFQFIKKILAGNFSEPYFRYEGHLLEKYWTICIELKNMRLFFSIKFETLWIEGKALKTYYPFQLSCFSMIFSYKLIF